MNRSNLFRYEYRSLSHLKEAILERSVGLPEQVQGISGRRRYTHTNVALSIQRPDLPQCRSKGQRHRRGIVQSCVDSLESGSGVPQPRTPYCES